MTVNISVSQDAYNGALAYAQRHGTDVDSLVEDFLRKLRPKAKDPDVAERKLEELIRLTNGLRLPPDDENGEIAKDEYMKGKYLE